MRRDGACEADECHALPKKAILFRGEVCVVACDEHEATLIAFAKTIWPGPFEVVDMASILS